MAGVITVVAIDDDPSIQTLLRVLFQHTGGFELVGDASDGGPEAVELVRREQPDIVLLDLELPVTSGHNILPELFRVAPRTMVLVLSVIPADGATDSLFSAGAFAYLEKSTLGRNFCDHLRQLHELFLRALDGESVWTPSDPTRIRR